MPPRAAAQATSKVPATPKSIPSAKTAVTGKALPHGGAASVPKAAKQGNAAPQAAAKGSTGKKVPASKKDVSSTKWTPQHASAAEVLLAYATGLYCRRKFRRERTKAAELSKLKEAAFLAEVEFERKQEAKRRKKAEEEAKRRKEEASLRKQLLEAAYDGDEAELKKLLAKAAGVFPDPADVADTHGNTLLSEAAAGGAGCCIALLLSLGADPNSQGEFKRSPLWRAAFLGKEEEVSTLLRGGADPRIGNESGELPEHVGATPAIKETLRQWDTTTTDQMVAQWRAQRVQKKAEASAAAAAAIKTAEDEVGTAQKAHETAQKALKHARQELEKRIFEHDTCVEEGKSPELLQATLEHIHGAEATMERARRDAIEAAEALDHARLQLREHQAAQQVGQGQEDAADLQGQPVDIADLDAVLVRDVGDKLKADGRWPLVLDPSGRASVFLRYMDSNYVNALSPHNTEPERLRRSLLGALRYGKPLVLDCMDVHLWHELPMLFERIQPGLMQALLSRSLLDGGRYMSLVKAEDGEQYESSRFQEAALQRFRLVLLTSQRAVPEDVATSYYLIRVTLKR